MNVRSRSLRVAASVSLLLGVVACGADDDGPVSTGTVGEEEIVDIPCPELPPDPDRVRVMVVDQGFDPRHPIFANKIAGCYRLNCPDSPDEGPQPDFASDDEAAASYLDHLSTPSPECTIERGAKLRIDSYLEHFDAAARAEWNDLMFQKKRLSANSRLDASLMLSTLAGLSDVEEGDVERRFTYHGTGTAGVIAYDSDVQLVLVERELGSGDVEAGDFPCIDPEELALELRLLQRPEIRDAWVKAPLSGMDLALRDLRRTHGVAIENHSFGALTTKRIQELLQALQCPEVPFAEYAGVIGELEGERDAYLREAGEFDGADPLIFQAAGNDGDEVNSSDDLFDCAPDRDRRLLVGSYDLIRGRPALSDFSNTGDCVDLYALGQNVIAPAPNGFYVPVSGTSIASPLAARYAADELARSTTDIPALRDRVLSARDDLRFLPASTMPTELSFYTRETIHIQSAPIWHGPPSSVLARSAMRRWAR